jgi:Holliday junction DNA helicase RuvA
MLSYLKGKVVLRLEDSIIVELNDSLGLKVYVSRPSTFPLNSQITIRTVLLIRENNFTIFGFLSEEEVNIFNLLLSVPNIGSKTSINILSKYSPKEILEIVKSGDWVALKEVSGIGEKSAKKIVLYLTEKVQGLENLSKDKKRNDEMYLEAKNALVNLGLTTREAKDLLDKVMKDSGDISNPEELIKKALKLIKK